MVFSTKKNKYKVALDLLKTVGLSQLHVMKYPHQLSGGELQRVGLARALALEPEILILDEPLSALNNFVKLSIIELLQKIQNERRCSYLFITHDLSIIRKVADKIAVIYLGKIVEYAEADSIFNFPLHPYTITLISSIPIPDPRQKREKVILPIIGEISEIKAPLDGCQFYARCRFATKLCFIEEPKLTILRKNHSVACHNALEIQNKSNHIHLTTGNTNK